MKYLDFEKHMRKQLEGAEEQVQMDSLLASLNLGKEPKRKGFAFWMIIPFLVLAIAVIGWGVMDMNTSTSTADRLTRNMTTGTAANETLNNSNSTEKTTDLPTTSNTGLEKNPQQDIESKESNEASFISSFNTPSQNKAPLKNTLSLTTSKSETEISQINRQNTYSNLSSEASNFNRTSSGSNDLEKSSEEASDMNSNSKLSNISEAETLMNSSTSYVSPSPVSKLVRETFNVESIENSLNFVDDNEVDGALFSRMKINCPSFENPGWHLALIPEIGVFLPSKTLENKLSEPSAAFNERLASESTLEGIELGLYGMLVRDNLPFYLKAGISYSRISERMDLQYEYVERDTTVGIISTTVSQNGDTITHIYGDIISETTYKGSNRQHHYIHLFDIPVSLGYTTYLGGLDIGIEGGVRFNFMTRGTGNMLVSEKDYTNLSLNRMFKNRIGLSYFGGLMIGRNFGKIGDFYVAPRFTYFPNDFSNQNNDISQKYFNVGLTVGMVHKIN